MRAADREERLAAQARTLQHPLRRVVSCTDTNSAYEDETLECGHILKKKLANWRNDGKYWTRGEWVRPKRRRCYLCPKDPQP